MEGSSLRQITHLGHCLSKTMYTDMSPVYGTFQFQVSINILEAKKVSQIKGVYSQVVLSIGVCFYITSLYSELNTAGDTNV